MKTRFALVLICIIPACAFGQTSNTIAISTLREEAHIASVYSPAGMKHLMETAQTEKEFGEIAAYFDRQAQINAAQYEAERKELYGLLAQVYHARGYAEHLETTRNYMNRYKDLSRKYSEQAELYRARENDAATGVSPVQSPAE